MSISSSFFSGYGYNLTTQNLILQQTNEKHLANSKKKRKSQETLNSITYERLKIK